MKRPILRRMPIAADDVRRRVEELAPWYQNIDLGDGVWTKDLDGSPRHLLRPRHPRPAVARDQARPAAEPHRAPGARHRLQRRLHVVRVQANGRGLRARVSTRTSAPAPRSSTRPSSAAACWASTSSSASSRSSTSPRSSRSSSCSSAASSTTSRTSRPALDKVATFAVPGTGLIVLETAIEPVTQTPPGHARLPRRHLDVLRAFGPGAAGADARARAARRARPPPRKPWRRLHAPARLSAARARPRLRGHARQHAGRRAAGRGRGRPGRVRRAARRPGRAAGRVPRGLGDQRDRGHQATHRRGRPRLGGAGVRGQRALPARAGRGGGRARRARDPPHHRRRLHGRHGVLRRAGRARRDRRLRAQQARGRGSRAARGQRPLLDRRAGAPAGHIAARLAALPAAGRDRHRFQQPPLERCDDAAFRPHLRRHRARSAAAAADAAPDSR